MVNVLRSAERSSTVCHNFTRELVGQLHGLSTHAVTGGCKAFGHARTRTRIVLPIEFYPFSVCLLSRIDEGKTILFIGLDLKLED